MKIRQRQKRVWVFTCSKCDTVLELDETDFKIEEVYGRAVKYISTPCPVCGKLWNNVDQIGCRSELIPVEE